VEVSEVVSQSSADLVAGAGADGVIVVPAGVSTIDAGATVTFRLWRTLS
jgi:molybdopterin biosynthesis enzyme